MENLGQKKQTINVRVLDTDSSVEELVKEIKTNNLKKSIEEKKKKKYNKYIILFILGILIGFFIGYSICYSKYKEIINDLNTLSAMKDEWNWRNNEIKSHITKNEQLSNDFEAKSKETVSQFEEILKTKKQKIVESN